MKLCISFVNFFSRYFCWPRLSQLKLSITQNSWAGNLVTITVILVSWEYSVLVIHCNLSISLEISRSGILTLRGSFAILTSFWRMKFDMWQPSGLVEVLIEYCDCNISETWLGSSFSNCWKLGIRYSNLLVWLIFNKSWNICQDLCRSVQIRKECSTWVLRQHSFPRPATTFFNPSTDVVTENSLLVFVLKLQSGTGLCRPGCLSFYSSLFEWQYISRRFIPAISNDRSCQQTNVWGSESSRRKFYFTGLRLCSADYFTLA